MIARKYNEDCVKKSGGTDEQFLWPRAAEIRKNRAEQYWGAPILLGRVFPLSRQNPPGSSEFLFFEILRVYLCSSVANFVALFVVAWLRCVLRGKLPAEE